MSWRGRVAVASLQLAVAQSIAMVAVMVSMEEEGRGVDDGEVEVSEEVEETAQESATEAGLTIQPL